MYSYFYGYSIKQVNFSSSSIQTHPKFVLAEYLVAWRNLLFLIVQWTLYVVRYVEFAVLNHPSMTGPMIRRLP